jgi:hypothetical protein
MNYEPMSAEIHLVRGFCCFESRDRHSRCVFCPWKPDPVFKDINVSSWIEEALISGEPTIYYSSRKSLVPQLTIQNLTIVYQPYVKPVPQREDSKEIR